jgi:hypothetical protein
MARRVDHQEGVETGLAKSHGCRCVSWPPNSESAIIADLVIHAHGALFDLFSSPFAFPSPIYIDTYRD